MVALGMALVAIVGTSARGAPADIFSTSAPVLGAPAQKAQDLHAGDGTVSMQTGAMQYSYPITVPPGRNGMQPHLELTYSSQAPIYGGIAAGWELPIPWVGQETSTSRLRASLTGEKAYTSSLAGNQPLVRVDEPYDSPGVASYRAQSDSSRFARYQRIQDPGSPAQGPYWRVLTPDGTTYWFGGYGTGPYSGSINCPNISATNAPLAQVSDSFGNYITYSYELATSDGIPNECRLTSIAYGGNSSGAYGEFATVTFNYGKPTNCNNIPVGSTTDYHLGFKDVHGGSVLTQIVVTAYVPGSSGSPDHTRVIDLGYDATTNACPDASHPYAAFRQLDTITEHAWGTSAARVDASRRSRSPMVRRRRRIATHQPPIRG